MPDDRSSGFFGGSGGVVRFNNNDSASRIPDKKRSRNQQQEPDNEEEKREDNEFNNSEFVDRSAQLSATLNSLAMINVANVLKNKSTSKTSIISSQKKPSQEEKPEL